jgi:hypothetical protein
MIANIDQLPLGSSDDDDNDDYNDYDQIIMHDLSSQANDNQFPEIVIKYHKI